MSNSHETPVHVGPILPSRFHLTFQTPIQQRVFPFQKWNRVEPPGHELCKSNSYEGRDGWSSTYFPQDPQ